MCASAAAFAGVAALAIAELCTTEAFAACSRRLLRRGLPSGGPPARVYDSDARVQRRCSLGRMMCAQVPLHSQVWRRWQLPNCARPRLLPRAQGVCSAAACLRAALQCVYTIAIRGCNGGGWLGAPSSHLPARAVIFGRSATAADRNRAEYTLRLVRRLLLHSSLVPQESAGKWALQRFCTQCRATNHTDCHFYCCTLG